VISLSRYRAARWLSIAIVIGIIVAAIAEVIREQLVGRGLEEA
jgi:hypothetical protein